MCAYIYISLDVDSRWHKNNRRQHVRTRSRASPTLHERIILRKSFRLGKEKRRRRRRRRKEKKGKRRKKGEALLTTATMSNARLLSNRHRRDYGHSLARIASWRDFFFFFFNLVQLGNAYVFVRRKISITVADVTFSTVATKTASLRFHRK